MIFSPRISTSSLVSLCRRVGNQIQAGVDMRRIWKREAERAFGRERQAMLEISERIETGSTLHGAILCTGEYFPKLFRQMVELGEETGQTGSVFLELADQYEHQIQMRRAFLAGILWPMIQLIIAILLVGVLIYVMGIVSKMSGRTVDILGLGLIGAKGVGIYFAFIGTVLFVLFAIYQLWSRGNFSFLQLDRFVMNIPMLGEPIRTLCLSRMAWAMAMTIGGGMDIRKAMRLSLEATHSHYYMQFADQVDEQLLQGEEVHDILRSTGSFPHDFLDVVETGEISGMLTESMDKLASIYQEKAKAALNTIAVIGGVLVWMLVAAMIIGLIVKLFSFYLGTLNEFIDNPLGDPRR